MSIAVISICSTYLSTFKEWKEGNIKNIFKLSYAHNPAQYMSMHSHSRATVQAKTVKRMRNQNKTPGPFICRFKSMICFFLSDYTNLQKFFFYVLLDSICMAIFSALLLDENIFVQAKSDRAYESTVVQQRWHLYSSIIRCHTGLMYYHTGYAQRVLCNICHLIKYVTL